MSDRIKKLMSEGRSRIQTPLDAGPEKKRDQHVKTSSPNDISFIARDIPDWKRESLGIVLDSTIFPEDLEILSTLSEKQKYLLKSIKELDDNHIEVLSRLLRDKPNLRTKLTLLTAWSNFTKHGRLQKGLSKVGGLFGKTQLLQK